MMNPNINTAAMASNQPKGLSDPMATNAGKVVISTSKFWYMEMKKRSNNAQTQRFWKGGPERRMAQR